MQYNRLGKSGLLLPAFSLGMWHNFGAQDKFDEAKQMILHSFEQGITHFDLANNYGPPPGSAESTLGSILGSDLQSHRDEILITTKAGWDMWAGPYGDLGSKKHLRASLDQSLKRLQVDYIDIFYHHRPDPDTPLEETIYTLVEFVKSGKVLYLGLCGYDPKQLGKAATICAEEKVPLVAYQGSHSLLMSQFTPEISEVMVQHGLGGLAYCPLFQGVLTGKYLESIPAGSRMERADGHLAQDHVNEEMNQKIRLLMEIAHGRGQTLTEMSLAWTLTHPQLCSTIIGARNMDQLNANLKALDNLDFSPEELKTIQGIIASKK